MQERFEENGYQYRNCGVDKVMSRRMKFFIFLLVINFIVVVIYVIWNHLRGKEKNLSTWMKADRDAFMPGGRTDVSLCSLFAVQAVYVTGDGSFRCCF